MKSKKKILLFMPSIEGGGAEKNFFIISNYLINKFEHISLITVSKKFQYKFNKKIKIISPKLSFWGNLKYRNLKYFICFTLLIKECFKDKSFIILSFQANLYATLISKILGIKIIIRSNASITGWSQNIIKKKISLLANRIIVNSFELKKQYFKFFGIKPEVIYNPLNTREIKKKSKAELNFKFFRSKVFKFISVGRLVDQKDHITLLKAFKLIKKKTNFDFRLLILGSGINEKTIRDFINDNKLEKKILLKKFVNNPYPYINKSNCVILSSVFEGLPNILLESQVLKKHIISSSCPTGPKEILLNGKGGLLFKPKNEKELFLNLIKMIKHHVSLKKQIRLNSNKIKRFDFYSNLKKYENLINKLKD